MAKRNALFKRASELLKKDGMSQDDAIKIAYQALIESRRGRKKKGHPGGQPGTPPVTIVEDSCLGELPDCSGESSNPFRRIDGTCNNVGESRNKREIRKSGGRNRGGNVTFLQQTHISSLICSLIIAHSTTIFIIHIKYFN